MNHQILAGCGAVALGTSLAALAQPAVNPPTVQLRYSSAFADYKPWRELPAGDWRQVNDAVGAASTKGDAPRADAAMAMPMPAARPANAESSPAAAMPPTNRGGHAGHGGKP